MVVEQADDRALDHVEDLGVDVLARQRVATPFVERAPLAVHHVVVVEQVLADVEVARLDLLLRILDHAREQAVLDRLAFFDADAVPPLRHPLGLEDPQQVVLEREEELGRARIALTAGAPAQLVVDAAALVALGADDVQAAAGHHLAALREALRVEIRAASPDSRDAACCRRTSRARRNSGFPPSTMSVPRPAMLVEMVTASLRPACATISASRSCCLALSTLCRMPRLSSLRESISEVSIEIVPTRIGCPLAWRSMISSTTAVELLALGLEHHVRAVAADHRTVGRDQVHVEVVDLRELRRLGVGRAGHARDLLVHAEEVLEGHGGERLVLAADRDPLLGLHRLVQAVGPAPSGHQAPGELVDDHHLLLPALAGAHDVVDVQFFEGVGGERLVHRVQGGQHLRVVEVLDAEQLLRVVYALLRQPDAVRLLVDPVVARLLDVLVGLALGAGPELRAPRRFTTA